MIERPSQKWQRTTTEQVERIARGEIDEDHAEAWAVRLWPAAPVAKIDEVLAVYEADIAALAESGAVPGDEAVLVAAEKAVTGLNEIDLEHGLIETGEREELCEYVDAVPRSQGVDMAALARRHGFDDGDLAGLWRDW